MAEKTVSREVRIAGTRFVLRTGDVRRALQSVEPEPIASHFVVIGGRRFPPKQVIGEVTGLDRADFTTHQARRILMRLGFTAGRRRVRAARRLPGAASDRADANAAVAGRAEPPAEQFRPLVGQWVAMQHDEVIYAAKTPQQLIGWLSEHNQKADTVFRVPEDEVAATGLAPR